MSIFNDFSAQCPECGAEQALKLVASVNADRRPDLRQQVLDHTFQARTCESCGATFRLPPRFTYQHFAEKLWVLVHPRADLEKWRELDTEAAGIFATNYGPGTSPMAEKIGREINPRVVFGWPALREKIVARAAGLDDIGLELTKMAVVREVADAPVSDETELRLDRVDGDDLLLVWVDGTTEAPETALRVPRSVYDEISADSEWDGLRAQLAGQAFVDFNRLLVASP